LLDPPLGAFLGGVSGNTSQIEECKNEPNGNIMQKYNEVKDIINTTRFKLQGGARKKNSKWITNDKLDLMEERRQYKNKNNTLYKQINRLVKKNIKEAKETWLT